MQQHTGIGLQGCLTFCRMWRRHWASVLRARQPEGQAVARLGPRRQSRAADVGGTAATDAHCSGGGADSPGRSAVELPPLTLTAAAVGLTRPADPPPPQTPTWAVVVGSRSLRRRPLPRRRKSCRLDVESKCNDFKFGTVYMRAH